MFLKKNIFSLLCALLMMSHNSSKPISVSVERCLFMVVVACWVGVLMASIKILFLTKKLKELVNKEQRQQEQLKTEKNNGIEQIIREEENRKEQKIEKIIVGSGDISERKEKINQDIEVLDISGDAVVEIDVNEQNDSRIEIVGYESIFDSLNIKEYVISKKLIVSQCNYSFRGENALKYKIYVKRLNAITISDKVWIQEINDHFDDAINLLGSPPMSQEMARPLISEKYKTLPVLKIITQNSSHICYVGTNYITCHRNIDLCSFDTSSVLLDRSFNVNVKTYNKSSVQLYAVSCVNVESRDMSKVVMTACSKAIVDEYDNSKVEFYTPEVPSYMHHSCIYNKRSNKITY